MRLTGVVNKPAIEIPSKPIVGLECKTEEPSGKRFWGVIQELCGEPENFFRHCWVHNICPLAFLTSTGRNITPSEIKGESKGQLNTICLQYLEKAIQIFDPKIIISVGVYANDCVKNLKKKNQISEAIECKLLPHPSPRALNNQNWVEKANKWYIDNDIIKYFQAQK
jgi:single-strand selective monofunctional uracil DNA glycosylase